MTLHELSNNAIAKPSAAVSAQSAESNQDSTSPSNHVGPKIIANWNARRRMPEEHSGYIAFSPNSKVVASGPDTVKVWDAMIGICTQDIQRPVDYVTMWHQAPRCVLVYKGLARRTGNPPLIFY